MPQDQQEQTQDVDATDGASEERSDGSSSSGMGTGSRLATAAAASVAAGASYFVAKRALAGRGGGSSGGSSEHESTKNERSNGKASSLPTDSLKSAMESFTWDRAQSMMVPMAERAADAAGEFVAREAPDVVRDRILPRFIEAFNKARSRDD